MSAATIFVDGTRYTIEDAERKSLLEACLSLGLDLPYFCWHPALHSVGACRQCAVKLFKDEADARGRLAMACMTPVTDGLRASIADPEARAFRAGVIEWLMLNHPHDCPICDEGGECHLQDMTVMTGHVVRHSRFPKRVHRSQDLGPFVAQEMNRCIQCYRCVRFYRDYAGGRDLDVQGWHDSVFFGRVGDGTLESEFAGNLCEVCPTGVFTDKTQAARPTRKWDLHTAPSVCPHCGVGCSTAPGERYGELRRVRPRYNADVNGYFLCDRGRYGQAFADSLERLCECLQRPPARESSRASSAVGDPVPVSRHKAMESAAAALAEVGAIGISSGRASLETIFALRSLVGSERLFAAMSDREFALHRLIAGVLEAAGEGVASPREAELSNAVLVLGEDVWNTAPILALRLRQASRNAPNARAVREKRIFPWDDAALRESAQDQRGPFFVATPEPGPLDDSAEASYRASSDDIARLGFAVAAALDADRPAVPSLAEAPSALAARIAAALLAAERPLVVSGSGLGSEALVEAAAQVFEALRKAGREPRICLVLPEADSAGLALLAAGGMESAERALDSSRSIGPVAAALVVVEADLYRAANGGASGRASGGASGRASGSAAQALLNKASTSIVIDHVATPTVDGASIVLPAAPNLESAGSYLSFEGRIQRFFALRPSAYPVQESWRWLDELAGSGGSGPRDLEAIDAAIATALPLLSPIVAAAPGVSFRSLGRLLPRGTRRESGRTAMHANVDPREPNPAIDPDSPLAFSMEGSPNAPPSLLSRYWSPGWNSDQSINKFQDEVGGGLKGGSLGCRIFGATPRDPRAGILPRGREGKPPAPFAPSAESLLVLPRAHCFGSEELSVKVPAVAERSARATLRLAPADAARLGFAEGALAEIRFEDGELLVLPFEVAGLPPGVASLPWGLADLPGPAWPRIARIVPRRGGEAVP